MPDPHAAQPLRQAFIQHPPWTLFQQVPGLSNWKDFSARVPIKTLLVRRVHESTTYDLFQVPKVLEEMESDMPPKGVKTG